MAHSVKHLSGQSFDPFLGLEKVNFLQNFEQNLPHYILQKCMNS